MAISTLKVGTKVRVKESNETGIIEEIERGRYKLEDSEERYNAGDLVAERSVIEKKKYAPPNKVSDQQALLNKAYAILIAELKPLHTVCEANLVGCTKKATQVHHRKGRRGILLIMSKLFSYLCPHCHDFCTENSEEAVRLGLSLPINSKTDFEFTDREYELIEKFGIKTP